MAQFRQEEQPYARSADPAGRMKLERIMRERGYDEARKTQLRNVFEDRAAAQTSATRAEAFAPRGLAGRIGQGAMAGLLQGVNMATLGTAPQLASIPAFVAGSIAGKPQEEVREDVMASQQATRRGLALAREASPVGSAIGEIGGLFTGAAGGLQAGVGRAVTAPLRRAIPNAFTAEAPLYARAAAQIGQNLVGGAGAVTALELARQDRENAT